MPLELLPNEWHALEDILKLLRPLKLLLSTYSIKYNARLLIRIVTAVQSQHSKRHCKMAWLCKYITHTSCYQLIDYFQLLVVIIFFQVHSTSKQITQYKNKSTFYSTRKSITITQLNGILFHVNKMLPKK